MASGTGGIGPPPVGYTDPPLPGVAAGSVNIFRGRLVIVFGPSGAVSGVFVYAQGTTPGPGNPPIFWATQSGTDPFGNALTATAGVAAGGTFEAGNTLITPSGILTYSAFPPALGGLIESAGVAAAFTDTPGNAVLAGHSTYANIGGTFFLATSVNAGVMNVYTATSAAGPWSQLAQVGGLQNDGETHFSAVGGSHLVADTILYKLNSSGAGREVWHDMRPLSNSFVGTIANRYPPQYRLAPDGNVEIAGYVQFPAAGGPNFNSIVFATLPALYVPGNNTGHKWPVSFETNVAPVGTPIVQVDTSGNLAFHNMPATGMLGVIASIYGRYPLTATQLIVS